MSASKLDAVYRSILLTKFFTKGWGKPENLRRLFEFRKVVSNRDECFKLIDKDYPVTITKEECLSDCRFVEGFFMTPLEKFLPGIVPQIAQKAHFQALLPVHWPEPGVKPVCLHLAGTGDHFFWRRRNLMVKPLLKEAGIGGIILENPFYGLRKPTDQIRSSLHNVSDIFVMGGCLILESLVLFHWCERNGLGPLGVTGLSMGGHMASLAATNWPKPLVLVPCLSWSTASAVFLQGVMSQSINWDLLEDQYLSDGVYREKLSKMVTIVDEAFLAGKKFAQTYSQKDEGPDAKIVKPTIPVLNKKDNLDITYKESIGAHLTAQNIIDVTKKVEDMNTTVPHNAIKVDAIAQIEKLYVELKKLLDEGKISQTLYHKLTSNEKFKLHAEDIEDINKLNQEDVKELILRYKIVEAPIETTKKSTNIEQPEPQTKPINLEIEAKTVPKLAAATIALKKSDKRSWNVSDLTSDWIHLPFMKSSARKIDISKIHWRDREALQFMRGIMDECTHLSNFSVPYDTSLIIAVCAKHDAYVPREDVGTLEEIWPGAEVRYVDAGHVTAYILHQSLFRACIKEAFERSKRKWKDGKHVNWR
ncbi:protein ABHD18 isoform X2 [Plodia interpunctella]|uniref:protein ABHD18 isoform X2 n=1 Tax=Plodia interpunctella TaxID=58824 RepID=UPI002367BD07|nr:protein ABHD18 isoform X2 [Plodia interpunctella]